MKPTGIPLKIREDRVKGIYVESHEEEVKCIEDIQSLLVRGELQRHVGMIFYIFTLFLYLCGQVWESFK